MIAASILAIELLAAVFSVLNLQDLSGLAREKEVAIADANQVLEAMRDTANTSLATLKTTNWTTWANTNVIATKGANELALGQESVATTVGAGDPAQVTLTLSWTHRQRAYSYRVMTLMTDRG